MARASQANLGVGGGGEGPGEGPADQIEASVRHVARQSDGRAMAINSHILIHGFP
jgi:hypothetical protein